MENENTKNTVGYENAAYRTAHEAIERAGLKPGAILVVGCSTSEVLGGSIGKASSPETGKALFEGISRACSESGVWLAAQCCEHLNRAIVVERAGAPAGYEEVNAIPQPKAGGSFASAAYSAFSDPVVLEEIRADAGLDIGRTLIGMHLKKVAVPLRLENDTIGHATVVAARTRPKYIGGSRAVYKTV